MSAGHDVAAGLRVQLVICMLVLHACGTAGALEVPECGTATLGGILNATDVTATASTRLHYGVYGDGVAFEGYVPRNVMRESFACTAFGKPLARGLCAVRSDGRFAAVVTLLEDVEGMRPGVVPFGVSWRDKCARTGGASESELTRPFRMYRVSVIVLPGVGGAVAARIEVTVTGVPGQFGFVRLDLCGVAVFGSSGWVSIGSRALFSCKKNIYLEQSRTPFLINQFIWNRPLGPETKFRFLFGSGI